MTDEAASSPLIPSWVNYLCIEGVIGAGKTSLCTMIADRLDGRRVLEEAQENPFLVKFYQNRRSFAFQTQLWFLVSRFKQLSGYIDQQDLFHSLTVSDYIFAKDRIFASVNLDDEEMALYDQVAKVMTKSIVPPDLVVYLQASTDTLMRRIERRGRPFEFNMDRRYIETLNNAYNQFFFHYTETPLLIVDTSDLDFVGNSADFDEIMEQISHAGKGTVYYRPMPAPDRHKLRDRIFGLDKGGTGALSRLDDTRIEEP